MIRLKITKDKFKSIIQVIDTIRVQLQKDKPDLKEWNLATANAHLYVLNDMSRKMRSKLPLLEDKPGNHKITWSVNENQALIIMARKDLGGAMGDSYNMATFQEISVPIYKILLS